MKVLVEQPLPLLDLLKMEAPGTVFSPNSQARPQGGRASHRKTGPLTRRQGLSQGGQAFNRKLGLSQGDRASHREAWTLTGRQGLSQEGWASNTRKPQHFVWCNKTAKQITLLASHKLFWLATLFPYSSAFWKPPCHLKCDHQRQEPQPQALRLLMPQCTVGWFTMKEPKNISKLKKWLKPFKKIPNMEDTASLDRCT